MKYEELLDILWDDNNNDIISMCKQEGGTIDFEQVMVTNYRDMPYAMLLPVDKLEGIGESEAILFRVERDEDGNAKFVVETDEKNANAVYEIYLELMKESENL